MAGFGGIAGRLYRGEVSINFVRRQRMWYTISGVILLVSVVALLVKGLNFSVDFKGGSSFTFPSTASDQPERDLAGGDPSGGGDATVQYASNPLWPPVDGADRDAVHGRDREGGERARAGVPHRAEQMQTQLVGPTWGSQITTKAIEALIIFLVVIVIYLSVAFEWRMAIGGVRRAAARHRDHDRRVRADRLLGQPDDRHRPADDPRLLALRHRGGLRQGPGEYRRPAHHPALHLQRRGQPGAQPDPGPVDQHLADRAPAGRAHPVHRRRACSARARSRTWRSCCSSACCPAPTPRSSSRPRCSPT